MRREVPTAVAAPLELAAEERERIVELADDLVGAALDEYERMQRPHGLVVNKRRWKCLKEKGGFGVFGQRTETHPPERGPLLVTVGKLDGDLNDIMFGLVAPTTEAMLVRSAYVQDNLMDGRVLAELQAPSQIDPMRSMTIKWAMRASSIFTRSFSRGRDFVFVESTGIVHMGEEGQRIGYHLVHSIPLAAIPSFERDHDVVRGHLSYCCLFRQKRRKAVELFMRGTFNLLGDVNATMAVAQTTETISTTMRYTYCAHMKKLAGFVRSSAATLDNALTTSVKGLRRLSSGSTCGACHRPSGAIRQKLCRICCKHVCSSCASPQKIASSVMRGGVPSIQQKRVHFCQNCVIASLNANAHTLAREEAFERYQAESDQEDEFAQGFDSPVSAWEMDQIPEESHLSWNSPANSNSDDEEFDNSSFRCHAFGW